MVHIHCRYRAFDIIRRGRQCAIERDGVIYRSADNCADAKIWVDAWHKAFGTDRRD